MFGAVSSGFARVFSKLSSKNIITDKDLLEATDEIKIALIGADVSPVVADVLVSDIRGDLIGKELPKTLSPVDAIASIVQKKLVAILGEEFKGIKPHLSFEVILLVGPYGSGKTTTSVKLAKHLTKKYQIVVAVASLDLHRPAAREQLAYFAQLNNIPFIDTQEGDDATMISHAIMRAQKNGINILIFDTPGIENKDGYTYIRSIHNLVKPKETILVLDSMIGQQSTQIAKNFTGTIPCTGVVLTKTEGDTRGGAAINIRYETKLQIKYIGTGEKADDFEEFHPSRIASRLLDKGDIDTIVEKAFEEFGEQNLNSMKGRILDGKMTFNDYLTQIQTMKKMGGLSKVMSFLPGASNLAGMAQNANTKDFAKQEAMILSMTPKERCNPHLLEQSSRRVRIARGSGTTLADVKKLMNQIEKMKDMSKIMKKMQSNGLSVEDLKNFDISKLQQMIKG